MFSIGQDVVCVKSGNYGVLVVGKVYTIRDMHECRCGADFVDVGLPDIGQMQGTMCPCGGVVAEKGLWCHGSRFAPLVDDGVLIEELVAVVK